MKRFIGNTTKSCYFDVLQGKLDQDDKDDENESESDDDDNNGIDSRDNSITNTGNNEKNIMIIIMTK